MKDRIKELKYLIYLKNEEIKRCKKELKELLIELRNLEGEKTLKRKYRIWNFHDIAEVELNRGLVLKVSQYKKTFLEMLYYMGKQRIKSKMKN